MNKIPAMPVLEPLSRATQNTLAPLTMQPTDFLEIDVNDAENFVVQSVYLKQVSGNLLPADGMEYVQTSKGIFIKDDKWNSYYASHNATTAWARRVPERKEAGYGRYEMAGTDFTALVIHHVWDHEQLIFKSEEAQILYTYLLKRFLVQCKSALLISQWKVNQQIPEMPKDYIEHPELPLTGYQKVGLLASLSTNSYSLFMEQGTGKTAVAIARVCLEGARKRAHHKGMYRVLVVCPQQVRVNWQREFRRFATVPGKTVILRGGTIGKTRCLIDVVRSEDDCAWSAAILSVDSVHSIWEALQNIKWDLVVLDESHYIKNGKTKRFKALIKIDELHTESKMILTGTPITNHPFDLWAQWEFLGKGLSGFKTYENFRSFHGKWHNDKVTGVQRLVAFENIPLLKERLARLAFIVLKSEANLSLPDKVYDLWEVSMTPPQAEAYRQLATQLVVEIDGMMADAEATGQTVSAHHILTKLLRLAQICSGFMKTDDQIDEDEGSRVAGTIIPFRPNPKIDALVEMVKEHIENDPNSKIIVWATFIEDMRAISQRFAAEGINHVGYHHVVNENYRVANQQKAEDVINLNPDCKVLLANPASAGVGQNFLGYDREHPDTLQTYVDWEIFFSCNWSAVHRAQAEDRAHRRGTRTNVRITDLIIPGTIDQEIRDRVQAKRNVAMSLQDVKEILKSVLAEYRA